MIFTRVVATIFACSHCLLAVVAIHVGWNFREVVDISFSNIRIIKNAVCDCELTCSVLNHVYMPNFIFI